MHTGWPAMQLRTCRPHHTFSVWFSLYTNCVSSASSHGFLSVQSNLPLVSWLAWILTLFPASPSPTPWHTFGPVSSCPHFPILTQFFPVMSNIHTGLSVDQGFLLVFSWCSCWTFAFIEVLFVMHSWKEMHSMYSYHSAILELLIFLPGKFCNPLLNDSKTANFGWHELIRLMVGYMHTYITGNSLTSNMQSSTYSPRNFC